MTVSGGVAEWFKAAVLKTVEGASLPWVRILPPPPFFLYLKKRSNPKRVLIEWYKNQAFVFFTKRLQYYKELLNCDFNTITITSAKKRLGSCDSKGNLRFSFYNILLNKDYIDYIVVHELCHLFYLDHSKAFWQMVGNIIPDFKQKRLWLRKNFHIIAYSL